MQRTRLAAMPLDELRRLAEARGIARAASLSRAELVEKLAAFATPPAPTRPSAPRVPSGTFPDRPQEEDPSALARRLLEEGRPERAAVLLRELLAAVPDDEALRAELRDAEAEIRRRSGALPSDTNTSSPIGHPSSTVRAISEGSPTANGAAPSEPVGMLDLEEPPELYGVDECEVLFKDPHTVFVWWELTEGGFASARDQLGLDAEGAVPVVRLLAAAPPHEAGPEREHRDFAIVGTFGRRYLPAPRPGVRLRAAVGLRSRSGLFVPIASSSRILVPPASVCARVAHEWMEVDPRARGREPPRIVRHPAGHVERGLPLPSVETPGAPGSSPAAGPPGSLPTSARPPTSPVGPPRGSGRQRTNGDS